MLHSVLGVRNRVLGVLHGGHPLNPSGVGELGRGVVFGCELNPSPASPLAVQHPEAIMPEHMGQPSQEVPKPLRKLGTAPAHISWLLRSLLLLRY